jgi:predicted alpha/beta superfamily hydrolase
MRFVIFAIALATGCTTGGERELDAGGDAGIFGFDAGRFDAGRFDAGRFDAGRLDAGSVDGGEDAGSSAFDAGELDAGFDAGRHDAGPPTTTIRIRYAGRPGAITIRGAGGPFSWTADTPTAVESSGVYVYETTQITARTEWKPRSGTDWARGPNYHVEPGDTIEVEPHFVENARGRVIELDSSFDSAFIDSPRVVWAYLPAGYDENTAATYPVVYMHDGQNLFEDALSANGEWEVDETMNAAAEAGRCSDGRWCTNDAECGGAICDTFHEAIVIGVQNGGTERIYEYTPTPTATYGGGGADLYLRALIEELKPIVDAMLRTRSGREDTMILGSSLGGLVSAYAGVRHPEVFGRVGAMSPSTWWDGRMIIDEVGTIPAPPALRALRVYVDSGDSGTSSDGVSDTADLAAAYLAEGYREGVDFHYTVGEGHQHNEASWAIRLPGTFAFLIGPREVHR